MPIIVTDFTWTQSAKLINIRVPISPVRHEKVDLFTTDSYIKAHYNPFLFEVFLLNNIDSEKSKCIVNDDQIMFDLVKREEVEWNSLEKELTKKEKLVIKQEILAKCQEEAKRKSEDKQMKKSQLDRYTVQQAMEIDTQQHALMDSRRNEERDKAMNALEEWRIKTDETGASYRRSEVILKQIKTPVMSEYVEKKKEQFGKRVLPKLRETGQLEISHTPRTFPTPSRESAADEEQAWLKNITLARRAIGFVSEDLRPEEQDPQWCKEKGDEFFRSGNYLGAISAYSHGITLSNKLPSLFANRSAAHFALGNFNKCMTDCSTALDLMKPACEGNRRCRAKCIARRAASLARAGYLSKAIDEMKAAAKLLPEDEAIKRDVYDMERAWEQNPDSD